ncbi:MAG TPA: flagellar basal-body MS-ring/collar protein FliF [Thermodesulfobacteriota bacterium]|nr:flagellar basal-body MS-ring/collar protein FliF [Thermodesulfobacteriota bacterium]
MATLTDTVEGIKSLSTRKKLILLGVLVLGISVLILSLVWLQRPSYQTLYSNLSEEDAGAIIQKLQEEKTPYRVSGGAILVPSDKVYELRLRLATQGFPQSGGVGFELFDETNLTMTDFVQKLNYRRALQGELARTIKSITAVDQCRIHLAIPERSLFAEKEERPKASVFVSLKPGRRLNQEQIEGIVHLVSSSVEGLDPKDVTIIDQTGEVLTLPVNETIGITRTQLEFQRNYEKDMEQRIINLLEPVVGKGKVEAKVTASIDFTRIEKTEERIDPDSQVVISEQRETEKSVNGTTGGVPGVASNLPNKTVTQSGASQSQLEKKNETINYEISKVVSRIVASPGEIKRISAVVLLDANTQVGTSGQKTQRSEEEIKQFEEMVKKAIGFTAERGDEVKVINMPFEIMLEEELPPPKREVIPLVMGVLKYLVPLLTMVLFFLLVMRPLIKVLTSEAPRTERPSTPLHVVKAETERASEKQEKPLKDRIAEWAHQNPEEAANLIKSWLEGG